MNNNGEALKEGDAVSEQVEVKTRLCRILLEKLKVQQLSKPCRVMLTRHRMSRKVENSPTLAEVIFLLLIYDFYTSSRFLSS